MNRETHREQKKTINSNKISLKSRDDFHVQIKAV